MKTMRRIFILVVLVLSCTVADDADATYLQPTTNRVASAAIAQFACVKMSTTANQVTTLLHTDPAGLMTGVAQKAAVGGGSVIPVQEIYGLSSTVISDGTTVIAAGDLIDTSNTVDGEVMKAPASPSPDVNTICTAMTAAAAVPGTQFKCL